MGSIFWTDPLIYAGNSDHEFVFDLNKIRDWYQTDAGKVVAGSIEHNLWDLTSCLFGYVAIEVGRVLDQSELLKNCTIRQKILVDRSDDADIHASPAALPVESDSVDLFLLTHTLDYTDKPHDVLREVERCLVAEGHLVIIGFNPISFYGVWKLFLMRRNLAPWDAKFYSIKRIRDWCSLLGFEEMDLKYSAHLPPFKRMQSWKRMQPVNKLMRKHLASFAGVYIFVARKRVARLTPLNRVWPTTSPILTGKAPKPTARVQKYVKYR